MQDKMRVPVPFKSPSAVLQYHENPAHAAHHASVASMERDGGSRHTRSMLGPSKDVADEDGPSDLPKHSTGSSQQDGNGNGKV